MFDSSVTRGEPSTFGLDEVIRGWTEGVQMMVEGEKRRFWIPPDLAYGDSGEVRGLLCFDIELLKIDS
jgi:FKBP-type peptidyl-prolyl cis-trans isomerase